MKKNVLVLLCIFLAAGLVLAVYMLGRNNNDEQDYEPESKYEHDESDYDLDLDKTETTVTYSMSNVPYFDYSEEAAAYNNFTGKITIGRITQQNSSEMMVDGSYAGLVLGRIAKLSEGAEAVGYESAEQLPSGGIFYIKDESGTFYRLDGMKVVKSVEPLGDGRSLVGEGRSEIVEVVKNLLGYYNQNWFHGTYIASNKSLDIVQDTDLYWGLTCVVKDVRLGTHVIKTNEIDGYTDDNYLILELVSKYDKTVTVEVCTHEWASSFSQNHRKVSKTVELKKDEPKTVVIKFEASTGAFDMDLRTEGNYHDLSFHYLRQ